MRPVIARRQPRLRAVARVSAGVLAGPLAVWLIIVAAACTDERPTLGDAVIGTTSTAPASSTTAPPTSTPGSTTVPEPVAAELGPEDLQGFIATPTGDPEVRSTPDDAGERLQVPATTPVGAPTTFAIIGDPASPEPPGYYEVLLPTRPNGATAWVPQASVTVTRTDLRLFVDLEGRTLRVERDGTEVFTGTTAVGTADDPTPTGGTYITELIDNQEPDGAYGPYAFGLALHSDSRTEFNGGPGQVGIHGTNRPDLIGQAVSHGCIRLSNADIEELVGLELPLGAPVFVT